MSGVGPPSSRPPTTASAARAASTPRSTGSRSSTDEEPRSNTDEPDRRQDTGGRPRPGRVPSRPGGPDPTGEHDRQHRPTQQLVGPGIGAVVRVGRRVGPQRQRSTTESNATAPTPAARHRTPPLPATHHPPDQAEHQWPDDVVLLLDAEGPEVQHRTGRDVGRAKSVWSTSRRKYQFEKQSAAQPEAVGRTLHLGRAGDRGVRGRRHEQATEAAGGSRRVRRA